MSMNALVSINESVVREAIERNWRNVAEKSWIVKGEFAPFFARPKKGAERKDVGIAMHGLENSVLSFAAIEEADAQPLTKTPQSQSRVGSPTAHSLRFRGLGFLCCIASERCRSRRPASTSEARRAMWKGKRNRSAISVLTAVCTVLKSYGTEECLTCAAAFPCPPKMFYDGRRDFDRTSSRTAGLVTFFLGKKVTHAQAFLPTSFQKEVGESIRSGDQNASW
jgi:hypothetical protein